VVAFQRQNPLRPGMPTARLAGELGIGHGTLLVVCAAAGLVLDSAQVRTSDHLVGLTEAQEASWAAASRMLEGAGVAALPRIAELGLHPEVMHTLVREGRLVKVSDDFVFLPSQIESIVESLGGLEQPFTVGQFKDATGMSRKYAVPFLEWADGKGGLTVRMGDLRRLRQGVSPPSPR
jgi:selenocysteine-specific elongation factor